MVSAGVVSTVERSSWFHQLWSPYVLLDSDLRICTANGAFENASGRTLAQLRAEYVFDAFPKNPDDPTAQGPERLGGSLELVLRSGRADWMAFQRYDVPDLQHPDRFRHKVWMPVNIPVTEDGRVVGVLHHVQDVTPALRAADSSAATSYDPRQTAETAAELQRLFPSASAETVLGLLTDSVRIVLETLGVPDHPKATALAKIRLEIRTRTRAQH